MNVLFIILFLGRGEIAFCCLSLGFMYSLLLNGYNLIRMLMDCTASMARKIYLRGGLGVGSFRRIYGGSKRNGSRPPHFGKSSGSVARHILQQLQNMNIVELEPRG